jgi:hypothetical protein
MIRNRDNGFGGDSDFNRDDDFDRDNGCVT